MSDSDVTSAIEAIPLKTIKGEPATLADFAGKVRLVVNVASKCGLTPQYAGLESLYRARRDAGLVVLGFPANDFAGQEPGSDEDIQTFCSTQYDVTFPMFAKLVATGPDKHPLYSALTSAAPAPVKSDEGMRERLASHGIAPNARPDLLWNFEKFVIGRDGAVIARFSPDTAADDPALLEVIEAALAD
jgi:glutathione peroxidase